MEVKDDEAIKRNNVYSKEQKAESRVNSVVINLDPWIKEQTLVLE